MVGYLRSLMTGADQRDRWSVEFGMLWDASHGSFNNDQPGRGRQCSGMFDTWVCSGAGDFPVHLLCPIIIVEKV